MSMRALILLVVLSLAAALPSPAVAQPGDSLSGAWSLDLQRSDPRRGPNAPPLVDTRLDVSLVGEDVRVVRNFGASPEGRVIDVTYQTDGKPHEVAGPMGNPVVVRARWAKDKLRVSYTLSRGSFDLDINEIWSLDKDGELTIQYSTRIGDRTENRRELYVRATASD
jgi:hypothetical protein